MQHQLVKVQLQPPHEDWSIRCVTLCFISNEQNEIFPIFDKDYPVSHLNAIFYCLYYYPEDQMISVIMSSDSTIYELLSDDYGKAFWGISKNSQLKSVIDAVSKVYPLI